MSEHVALLGDSIFDNRAYTRGEPAVIEHLKVLLPPGWTATLTAIDGSTTSDLDEQLALLPNGVTRAILSVGGNDALLNADLLNLPVMSTREALLLFSTRCLKFEVAYRAALDAVVARIPALTVCTIYNGNLPPDDAPTARIALMLFNDVILRAAFERGLNVIDLRAVCSEAADYANPIEPSGQGGRKIASAIAAAVGITPATVRSSVTCAR